MDTRYLKTLLVAVEVGSFSRAAKVLNITQSAASQRIKFLEDKYDHQLLDRSGAQLVPTEVGALVLEKARRILEEERELQDELSRVGSGKRFSLCCTPTFGMAYLPCVLNDFIRKHADIQDFKFIFHSPEQALEGLLAGDFDLAIIEHCNADALTGLHTLPLLEDELIFVSSPELGLPEQLIDLELLLGYRLYARKEGCSSRQLLNGNLVAAGKDVGDFNGVLISDDLRLTIQSVLAGSGVAFISRSLVAGYLEHGTLRAHHVEGFQHFRCRTMVVQRKRVEDPILQSFIESVGNVFSSTPQGRRATDGAACALQG